MDILDMLQDMQDSVMEPLPEDLLVEELTARGW